VSAIQADAKICAGVRQICKVLGVSASGYYAWRHKEPGPRAKSNAALVQRIKAIHRDSDASYGMPRVRLQLAQEGICVSRKRIARLMRQEHLRGVSRRRAFVVTTERAERDRPAPDLVERDFTAGAANQLWVADITYIPTWEGILYLAVVLDVFSRRVVGWAMDEKIDSALPLRALDMALQQRQPGSVIHHSDQGSQYTSAAFRQRCLQANVRQSMGSVGDAYDNAMAESFFATLECELIDRRSWRTRAEARSALFIWLEAWYNPRRIHTSIGCSPMQFEQKHRACKHGFPTAAVATSQAPPAAVENPAPSTA
jgi:putative transposase